MTTFLKKNSVLIVLLIVIFLTYLFYLIFKDTPSNYVGFADYFASIVLLFGIVLSSFIYLSNSYAFFNKRLGRITNLIIKGIPEDIPFGRKVKSYLTSLLKDNKKVIIFLPYPTITNREAVLLQLLGFLEYLEVDDKDEEDISFKLSLPERNHVIEVEIIFIKPNSDDISYYFNEEIDETTYEYIIITGMSEVYKDAIFSKNFLEKDKQDKIKIIGALSSISIDIEGMINDDENIIRVFPPDYDESKIAINYLMSRIKNNICHFDGCDFQAKKSNIIILHANEYGDAIKSRCKEFFELEMRDINKTTNTKLSAIELEKCINFYSFTYKDKQLIYDIVEDNIFENYIKKWEEEKSTNYFFVVGYQPSISNMLNFISPKIESKLKDFSFLFSSPLSLNKWRKQVCNTLEQHNLDNDESYYLSAISSSKNTQNIDIDEIKNYYKNYKVQKIFNRNELKSIKFENLFNDEDEDIQFMSLIENNLINDFNKNNFVSNFAELGINVAREYVLSENSLLACKKKVFEKNNIDLKLLMNGDSINNFQIRLMNCDKNTKIKD
jgi:hypothetical protein